jgi:hypothetical protein
MGIQIEDGKGTGILTEVNPENRLRVLSASGSLANNVSVQEGNVYTVIGTSVVTSTQMIPVHVINNDTSLILVLDRIIIQGASLGPNIPNTSSYFSLGYGRTVTSGGTSLTTINLNRTSTKSASVTATGSNPNMTGTFVESHRSYVQPNASPFELIRADSNDIVLGRSNTLEVQYNSNSTSGAVIVIIKFMMTNPDNMS